MSASINTSTDAFVLTTSVVDSKDTNHGRFLDPRTKEQWEVSPVTADTPGRKALHQAAQYMRSSHVPLAFPTETVYGLGADATRSEAVRGIYKAKGRPSDNPLIIHVCDLDMLRRIIRPTEDPATIESDEHVDPIPEIYHNLIERFWPGPLTILLPNPPGSKLAPEVTAGQVNFGVRMPDSPLALSLISLVGQPLAAPSANASTKPSPTTAQHVLHDLNGRIEYILDGGSCGIGLESTVVDGLCDPPVVLRPGGLSIDDIRLVPGWERIVTAYKDESELASAVAPRAPGMKYKHYSPKAKVVLFEHGPVSADKSIDKMIQVVDDEITDGRHVIIGIIATSQWSVAQQNHKLRCALDGRNDVTLVEMEIGKDPKTVAKNLFSSLRSMDLQGVHVVFIEGIMDEGDIAAAVMNRLRKAATDIVRS